MAYQSYYQRMVADNPYTTQTQQPTRDHGLWDVIGRAIRSTVPTRENKAFDKSRPVSDDNLPYEQPGFFRALAGDRGRDYNNDAMLRQHDLDTADTLEGKNFAGWKKGADYEDTLEDDNIKQRQGFLEKMQNAREGFQNMRDLAHERMQREIADTTGINWLRREQERNRGRMDAARYRALHPYSQQIDPSTVRLNNARAAELERKNNFDFSPTGTTQQPKGFWNFIFPSKSSMTNRIKINPADVPGSHPADMKSSGAVQNGLAPAYYDFDDDDENPYPTGMNF